MPTHPPNTQPDPRHRPSVLIWLLALITVLPLALMAWTASKPRDRVDESYRYLAQHLPESEVLRKFEIPERPLQTALLNSTVVSLISAILCVTLASLAGYAFAKRRFPGRNFLFDLVIVSMSVPAVILMMPLFRLTVALRIYDTLLALILPFAVTGFGILYMRSVISSVPDSVIESGRLDGLTEFGVLFRLVIPQVWPSVITLAVLNFITSWGSFVLPHALIASPEHYTASILLGRLMFDYGGLMWNDIMIVVIAAILPVLLIYAAFSRSVLKGLTFIGEERLDDE